MLHSAIPIYAQLNFRNYFSECFIHTVNFFAKWPLAFRRMLQHNCCVNIDGNKSKGIELDAFVEAEIVQPLKTYVSGINLLHAYLKINLHRVFHD